MKKLNVIDLFGTTFRFSTFGESRFHTWLGLFLSVVLYAFIASFIGVFGLDLFNRSNPKIITEGVRPLNYTREIMSTKNFTFAWRLEDESGTLFDYEGILYPAIEYVAYERNPKTGELDGLPVRHFKPTRCNETLSPDSLFNKGRNISNWYCLDFSKNDMNMGGFWDGDFVYYFTIYVYYCKDNNAKKGPCTSLNDLKQLLIKKNRIYFSILYPDFFFEPNNLVTPLRYQYVNYYNTLSANLPKIDRVFFKTVEAEDDQDLLFTKFVHHEQKAFDKFSFDFSIKLDDDFNDKSLGTDLYSMVLYYSKGRDKFIRTFMKLQDLAALVGGFMQVMLIAGKVLCQHYNSYQRNITLINEIFEFDESALEQNQNSDKNVLKMLGIKTDNNEKSSGIVDSQTVIKLKPSLIPDKNLDEKDKIGSNFNSTQNLQSVLSVQSEAQDFKTEQHLEVDNHKKIIATELKTLSGFAPGKGSNKNVKKLLSETNVSNLKKGATSISEFGTYSNMNKRKTDFLSEISLESEEKLKKGYLNEPIKQNDEFSIGLCLYIQKLCCRKGLKKKDKKQVSMYEFALTFLMDKLDITSYMNVLNHIDKMQFLNYNETQKYCFKCMKKPNLMDEKEMALYELKYTKDEENHNDSKDLNLLKYFVMKFQEDMLDQTDEMLFDLLETKFKNVVKNHVNNELKEN